MMLDIEVTEGPAASSGRKRHAGKLDDCDSPARSSGIRNQQKCRSTRHAEIYRAFKRAGIAAEYDQQAAIGRRYRRMDEIGTPYCITVDSDTL